MKRWGLALMMGLLACAPPEATRRVAPDIALPAMKTFSSASPLRPAYSNAQLARDFLDLTFELENGDTVPAFTRFEGPITVRVIGSPPPTLAGDLDRLLVRLRREAGLNISKTSSADATITIEPMPRRKIQQIAPTAACFVRPNVASWEEFRKRRNDPATFWNRLVERRKLAVFLPNDVSPQEVRDCLHEEIAQGLGPVNDIYRLSMSVFNDDNFHAVLTGYDMLMLAVTYDRSLSAGMSRQAVAQRLPEILARRNPRGGMGGIAPPARQMGAWDRTIAQATSPRVSDGRKLAAAQRAVSLAKPAGANDPRLAFSYYVLGRQSLSRDPKAAFEAFATAAKLYSSLPESDLQAAHIALQIAAFQLSAGRADEARKLVDAHLGVVRRAEHAALLSLLMLVKSEALALEGQTSQARQLRQEALAWGRYGFGAPDEVRARADEIAAISPKEKESL